jgi:hypothetical protein
MHDGIGWLTRWLLGRRSADTGPGGPATASAPAAGLDVQQTPANGATAFLLARRAADDSARIRAGSLSPDTLVSWGLGGGHAAPATPAASTPDPGGEC